MLIFYFLALFFSFLLLSNLLKKKKNLPPSPLTLPILGHLHLLKKPLPQTLQTLSAHYGPILFLRLGFRPVLLVSSPSAVEECFTKNDIIFANRPPLIAGKHLGYNHTTLEWAPYGHHWRHLRRIATVEIFSSNSLQTSSAIRSEEVRHMIRQLFQRSSDDRFQHLEFKSKFFELTFNIMMRMVAGKRYFDGEVADMEEARRSQEVLKETFFPSKLMNLSDFFPVLKWVGYQGPKWLIRMKRKKDSFLQALIDECRSIKTTRDGSEKEKTLIGILLSLQEAEPEYYTDEIIKGIIAFMFTAGTETTNATLEAAMWLLLTHPEAFARARAELDLHVEQGRLLDDSDLSKLPYLQCIINETLRLHPPAPIPLPHQSSEECTVGGYDIPPETILLVNAWAIHRDPDIWAEPMRFKPERFEEVGGEREGFKLMAFGAGRRGCPGAGLAMRMVALAVGALVQCFEWEESVDMNEVDKLATAMYRPRQTMTKVFSEI